MAKPAEGKTTYKAAKDTNGDVVIIALDKVTDGKLSEAEQKQFAVQIEQATQIGLQSSLLNALRAKAKIEINESFINQEQ